MAVLFLGVAAVNEWLDDSYIVGVLIKPREVTSN